MLATLNSRQIVDEIVKDTVKDNDPHDAVQISPDMVLASRPISVAPASRPEITARPEPKIDPTFAPEPPSIRSRNSVPSWSRRRQRPRSTPPCASPPAMVAGRSDPPPANGCAARSS